MSYKYSVIIPVYKAQDTLKRCVDSLLIQNHADAEIILVNDGSPDDCGKICEEYAAKHSQVKYIAKENGGVSSARNAGLDAASGTYITFVDSDDYVADNYFAEIDKTLAEYDWDYILFSTFKTDGKNVTETHRTPYSAKNSMDVARKIADEIHRSTINGPVTKVYKKSIIEKYAVRFNEELYIGEDWGFNIKYALNISSICRIDSLLYYVSVENADSLSRRVIPDIEKQSELSAAEIETAMDNCRMGSAEKDTIQTVIDFSSYKTVYTKAKIKHRQGLKLRQRLKAIHAMCRRVNAKKRKIPKTWYCRLISLPVKLNFALAIDIIAWKLVH